MPMLVDPLLLERYRARPALPETAVDRFAQLKRIDDPVELLREVLAVEALRQRLDDMRAAGTDSGDHYLVLLEAYNRRQPMVIQAAIAVVVRADNPAVSAYLPSTQSGRKS